MENESEHVDPEYVRRFNDGYILAKYMPELSEQVFARTQSDSTGFRAMQDGRKQFLTEQAMEKAPSWLKKDPRALNKVPADKNKEKGTGPQVDPDR